MSRPARLAFLASVIVVPLTLLAVTAGVFAEEFRTWSDTSGKFKIKAKFVSEKDGTLTLEQEDGSELEIEVAKLSAADQKIVADLKKGADNPFKAKTASPFTPKKKGSTKPGTPATGKVGKDVDAAEPRVVKVDWSDAETIAVTAPGDPWKVEVGEATTKLPARLKAIPLPAKTNFFEGLKGLAVNAAAGKVAAGYLLGEPKPNGITRLVICDLETGKATPPAVTSGQMVPLALHDDGKQVVMRREEFGFGNHDRLEVWKLNGTRVEKVASWIPHDDQQGGGRDITWGAFLDADHLATYGAHGDLAVWKFPELTPEYHVPIAGGGVPALSPDRKRIAFCDGKAVGLFDVEKREVIAQQQTPMSLHAPRVAFSPSGKRLACISQDKLLVWDVATGATIQNMTVASIHIFTGLEFPHENYVLGGNRFLIDIENQLKLWTYDGHEQVATVGEWTLFGTLDGQKSAALLPVKLPHAAAADLQKKAATDPSLFILRPGVKVRVDVNGISDATQRDAVTKALAGRLKTIGCEADAGGTLTLAASIEGPKEKTLSLRNSGDYKVQEYVTRLRLLYENKSVWESSTTNMPGGPFIFVNLEEGENIGTWLKRHEKPDYALYDRIELPKYVQKPAAGANATGSLTLGTSRVTPSGVQ